MLRTVTRSAMPCLFAPGSDQVLLAQPGHMGSSLELRLDLND